MPLKTPSLASTLIFSDDPQLAARLSCILATVGSYIPVINGPRWARPDRDAEIVRRTNAAWRAKAKRLLIAGVEDEAASALERALPRRATTRVGPADDPANILNVATAATVTWGRENIGVGMLRAMRQGALIAFEDRHTPDRYEPPKNDHLVVCEMGDEILQVIAANYAFALGAGLFLIPETDRDHADEILERFYSVYDNRETSASTALRELRQELRSMAGHVPIPQNGSVTFFSDGVPFGFAFPEVPSTHLLSLDAGIEVVNGFAAEQPGARGVQVAVMVNPETTPAPEINVAAKILSEQRQFVRVYEGPTADVTSISEMVELFPYDLMVIATHCGDVSGHRWTYEFVDSEDIPRTLIVDIALGIGRTSDRDLLHVTQFLRFVSLDGVPWNDPHEKAKLYVGKAIRDFVERTRPKSENELQPTLKDTVDRVVGSAALKMFDHNFIALPRSVANGNTPTIINNACVSWRRLVTNFMFGGARAYVGTLFPISTTEAESVLLRALGKHHGKLLPHALWSAQRETYDDETRRPYVVAGVYTQRIRAAHADVPRHIVTQLRRGLANWTEYRDDGGPHPPERQRTIDDYLRYFERELEWFRREWNL